MLIEQLQLTNFLSFGQDVKPLRLGPLNVLIGPNGAGKSNLLEALALLKATPTNLAKPMRDGGGVGEWLFKGGLSPSASVIDAVIAAPKRQRSLRYLMSFAAAAQRLELVEERVETVADAHAGARTHYLLADTGVAMLAVSGLSDDLNRATVDANLSILAQRRDPLLYPEISYLASAFDAIKLYRDWQFGRAAPARRPQDAAGPNDHLAEDCSNLGLVLNSLSRQPQVKDRILEALRVLFEGIVDYGVSVEGGTVQVFLREGNRIIPAARLSDGTLRYLCLLAILCHPDPPALVCIEEPELGLHPDMIPTLAELLREASERMQLIVTTHSDRLIDTFSDDPEAVVVVERDEKGSSMRRLDAQTLRPWLEKYRLGALWTRGDIGGNRW